MPKAFLIYLAGIAVLVALSQWPSAVDVKFSWFGGIVGCLLLLGLVWRRSNAARWLLVIGGFSFGVGIIGVQSSDLDAFATAQGAAWLLTTGLLLVPSVRAYTSRHGGEGAAECDEPTRLVS